MKLFTDLGTVVTRLPSNSDFLQTAFFLWCSYKYFELEIFLRRVKSPATCCIIEARWHSIALASTKLVSSYPVMETSSDPFGVDPQLPLSRSSVPTVTGMVPSVQPQRVVQSEEGVAVD